MQRKGVSYARYGYLFSLPFVLVFLVFSLYPIIYTIIIGFTDLRGIGKSLATSKLMAKPFQNFQTIINTPGFQISLSNTALIWIINFIPQILIALLLAAWFTSRRLKVKGQGAFKIMVYMPNIITAASIAILFNTLFGYPVGPVNDILQSLGIISAPVNFTLQRWSARFTVSFIQFWMWYGNTMIVLIAGILGISPSLFESAEIDGASSFQVFRRITLPSIRSILLYTLVTSLIGGLQMFDIPKLYLLGGPDQATLTAAVFIYNQAFSGAYMYNRASAASMILFIIILIPSGILFYVLRDKDAILFNKQRKAMIKAAKLAAKSTAKLAKEGAAI
jgi:cellobiose transport system permease protein